MPIFTKNSNIQAPWNFFENENFAERARDENLDMDF